jgi:hypothetical protein
MEPLKVGSSIIAGSGRDIEIVYGSSWGAGLYKDNSSQPSVYYVTYRGVIVSIYPENCYEIAAREYYELQRAMDRFLSRQQNDLIDVEEVNTVVF